MSAAWMMDESQITCSMVNSPRAPNPSADHHLILRIYVCKRDMKSGNINPTLWENIACNQIAWRKASLDAVKLSKEKETRKTTEEKQTTSSTLNEKHGNAMKPGFHATIAYYML